MCIRAAELLLREIRQVERLVCVFAGRHDVVMVSRGDAQLGLAFHSQDVLWLLHELWQREVERLGLQVLGGEAVGRVRASVGVFGGGG